MKYLKLYISIALLTVLLGIGFIYVPSLINWNAYKQDFRTAIYKVSGCHLFIDGDMSMDLLPTPKIILNDVRVTEDSEIGAPGILAIRRVYATMSLRGLVQGQFKVNQMDLLDPTFLVPVGEQQICDQNAPGMLAHNPDGVVAEGVIPQEKVNFSITRLNIQNGGFSLKLPGKSKPLDIRKINLVVDIQTENGRAAVIGNAQADNSYFDTDIKLSGLTTRRAPSLDAEFLFPALQGRLSLSGVMTQPLQETSAMKGAFNGKLHFTANDSKAFLAEIAPGYVIGTKDIPFNFTSDVQITSRYLGLNNYSFENGPLRGTGAVSISLEDRPVFDILYSANSLDVDNILATVPIAKKAVEEKNSTTENIVLSTDQISKEEKSAAKLLDMKALFHNLLREHNADVSLDVSIGAFKYLGGVIREAGLHIAYGDGSLTLDRASAIFPGGSDISLFGFMEQENDIPQFDGKISIQSDDFKRFLSWVDAPDEVFQSSRLRSFSYHGNVAMTPDRFDFKKSEIKIDNSILSGGFSIDLANGIPKAMVDLNADKLNLDAYLDLFLGRHKAFENRTADQAAPTINNAGGGHDPESRLKNMSEFETDVRLSIGQMTLFGEAANNLNLAFQMRNNDIMIERLSLSDFNDDDWFFEEVQGTISSQDENLFAFQNVKLKISAGDLLIEDIAFNRSEEDELNLIGIGSISGVNLGRYLANIGDLLSVDGDAGLSFKVVSNGINFQEIWENLQGSGDLTGGVVLTMTSQQEKIVQVKQLSNLKQFMVRHFASKPYPITGHVIYKDGQLTIKGANVESTTAVAHSDASIDLLTQRISARFDVAEKQSNESYLTLMLNGSLQAPSIKSTGTWINTSN